MSQFGVDYDAAMAGATLLWRTLGSRQKSCLIDAGCRIAARDVDLAESIYNRGLTSSKSRWARVHPMGLLVRLAGIAESKRIEAMVRAATGL